MLDPDESKIVRKYQRETNTTRKADYDQQKQKTRKTTKNKQIDKIGLHSPLHQFPTLGRQDSRQREGVGGNRQLTPTVHGVIANSPKQALGERETGGGDAAACERGGVTQQLAVC